MDHASIKERHPRMTEKKESAQEKQVKESEIWRQLGEYMLGELEDSPLEYKEEQLPLDF